MEALGFISLWGFTPSIDFLTGTPHTISDSEEEKPLNVLLSECADVRHVLRTLSDNLPTKDGKQRSGPINIYIHEKQKENLCRDILFLTLMCER
jgi:hypothetical protein